MNLSGVRHRSTDHGTIWEGVYAKAEAEVLTTAGSVDETGAWNQLNQCLAGEVPWSEHVTQLGRTHRQLRCSFEALAESQSDFLSSTLECSVRRHASGPLSGLDYEPQAVALDEVFYRMACIHDDLQQAVSVRASLHAEDRAVAVRSTPLWRALIQLVELSALALAVASRTFGLPQLAKAHLTAGSIQVTVCARTGSREGWAEARTAEWMADPAKQSYTARQLASRFG